MLVRVNGQLGPGVTAKDIALAIIGHLGTAGATGYVIEYAGDAITSLNMAGRMTVCNMSIEAGARAGMIAPAHVTFEYLRGRQLAPAEGDFETACSLWRALPSEQGAKFDRIADVDDGSTPTMVTLDP